MTSFVTYAPPLTKYGVDIMNSVVCVYAGPGTLLIIARAKTNPIRTGAFLLLGRFRDHLMRDLEAPVPGFRIVNQSGCVGQSKVRL